MRSVTMAALLAVALSPIGCDKEPSMADGLMRIPKPDEIGPAPSASASPAESPAQGPPASPTATSSADPD